MSTLIRALICFAVLLLFWGTFIVSPFRFFADSLTDALAHVFARLPLPSFWVAVFVILLCGILLILFLRLGTRKAAPYLAGICAMTGMLFYLVTSLQTWTFDLMAIPVMMGLAAALLLLMFKAYKASLWLSDLYIYSLLVVLFLELLIVPLTAGFSFGVSRARSFWSLQEEGLSAYMEDFLGLPTWIWTVFFFLLLLVPTLYFSRKRKKEV